MNELRLVASFDQEERCIEALKHLLELKIRPRVFSPIPCERIIDLLYEKRSRVRGWVLGGGIFGALSGFALTLGTSYEWSLRVGGKPIASIPAYLIIVFELMILCGGLAGVSGFFMNTRMPVIDPFPGYDGHFSGDHFGVVVVCEESATERLETLFKEAGADQVEREAIVAPPQHAIA
ncbi:MAG: DUF3341 domain-containing protein [Candidatus Binataceae bacterium]|nr:DUF3341 domain-containing protein [Candidatus Binataceae bacterium]